MIDLGVYFPSFFLFFFFFCYYLCRVNLFRKINRQFQIVNIVTNYPFKTNVVATMDWTTNNLTYISTPVYYGGSTQNPGIIKCTNSNEHLTKEIINQFNYSNSFAKLGDLQL
jgi:hypothetical protein